MVKTLTDEQYSTFMMKIPAIPARDHCILLLLLQAGLRNGELCALRFRDIYSGKVVFSQLEIHNGHGHNENTRLIPLTVQLIPALEQYLSAYTEKFGTPDPMKHAFVTRNQKIPIQQRDVQRITAKWTRELIGCSFHPHAFRHTFATRLMRRVSMRIVQQLLGHTNISSTQVYTHPSSEDRVDAINQAF